MIVQRQSSRQKMVLPELTKIPDKPGVYAFWRRELPRCVYVGQSQQLQYRVRQHWLGHSSNQSLQDYMASFYQEMEFCYRVVSEEKLDEVEQTLIAKLKPLANKQGVSK